MSITVRKFDWTFLEKVFNFLFFPQNQVSSNGKSQVSNGLLGNQANCDDELNVETELENFEKLLSQMMQFRSATSEMNREDQLNCAQGFAEIFEKLISQDEDVNQLNND